MNDLINRLLLNDPSLNNFSVYDLFESYSPEFIQQRINSIHSVLAKKNVKGNEIIGLLSENSIDFICSVVAIWRCGALPAPINTRNTSQEINSLITLTGSRLLLCSNKFEHLQGINCEVISLSSIQVNETSRVEFANPSPENDALIIFTSGSTGIPKAVVHTFSSLISSARNGNIFIRHNDKDVWLAGLPFYHIGGFSIILRSIIYNCGLVITTDFSSSSLKELAEKHNATLMSVVSVQMKRLIEDKVSPPLSLRNILLGGGAVSKELASEAVNSGWVISLVYGSSESASFVTALDSESIPIKPGSAGKAVGGNKIMIVDEYNAELKPGISGQICISSSSLFRCYLNNTDFTNAAFHNGWYLTGDYGYLDEEGYLFVETRRRDLIVTGGENVSPAEVEQVILSYPGVSAAAVIGISDDEFGEIVVAAIETGDNIVCEDDIRTFLKKNLAGFKVPKKIVLSSQLPKNELGKIILSEVEKLFRQ